MPANFPVPDVSFADPFHMVRTGGPFLVGNIGNQLVSGWVSPHAVATAQPHAVDEVVKKCQHLRPARDQIGSG